MSKIQFYEFKPAVLRRKNSNLRRFAEKSVLLHFDIAGVPALQIIAI
jgi:hypothetical protein